MKPSRLLSVLVLSLAMPRCEPPEQAPQPATPASVPPAASNVPAPTTEPTGTDEGAYASPEYVLGADSDSYDDTDPSAVKDFKATLEPYGTWTDDTRYGTVWSPSQEAVGEGFTPYATSGHWAYDDEWVWVSDYSWGWVPFHYGRWIWIEGRGWAWVPGRAYAGAWVAWGVDDGYGYVGWAPLGPQFFWYGGVAIVRPVPYPVRWVYCPRADVFSPALRSRIVAGPAIARVAIVVHPVPFLGPGHPPAGPSPQRLGYNPAQIPHSGGSRESGVPRARQFAHPSTAQALGASPPVTMPTAAARPSQVSSSPAAPPVGTAHAPPSASPARLPSPSPRPSPPEASRPGAPANPPVAPAPVPRPGPPSHFTPAHGRK